MFQFSGGKFRPQKASPGLRRSHFFGGANSIDGNKPQQAEIAEHFPGSQHHRRQRIVRD
jgi:hypothetical protein